jgi:hypothetical protein
VGLKFSPGVVGVGFNGPGRWFDGLFDVGCNVQGIFRRVGIVN